MANKAKELNTDPFGRLPWFVLQGILSNLPDLSTLHRLYTASPEIAAFLNRDTFVFARVVDAIIGKSGREEGLATHVQDIIRLIILVWTRQRTAEPVQRLDTDIFEGLRYASERCREDVPMLKTISPLTSSAVLCQLLRLMTRVRRLLHAYFHSMIAKCLSLQSERLPRGGEFQSVSMPYHVGDRPLGIPYAPVDIGPPAWVEEQRLLASFLCVVLFYELRKIHTKCSVVTSRGNSVHVVLNDDVDRFWNRILRSNKGQVDQIETLLHWLDQQAGERESIYPWVLSVKTPEHYSYCCQHYTNMIPADMCPPRVAGNALNRRRPTRDALSIVSLTHDRGSPLKSANISISRSCGLAFWDGARLDKMGFPGQSSLDRMWFAWSSIFTEDDWKDFVFLVCTTRRIIVRQLQHRSSPAYSRDIFHVTDYRSSVAICPTDPRKYSMSHMLPCSVMEALQADRSQIQPAGVGCFAHVVKVADTGFVIKETFDHPAVGNLQPTEKRIYERLGHHAYILRYYGEYGQGNGLPNGLVFQYQRADTLKDESNCPDLVRNENSNGTAFGLGNSNQVF
ncbi:hypothetical protein BDV25DRAFT_136168 [Aspergillus avenaceus]|uniref:F-box domain-containing protein n=1 Tax=Aspergillus avenaceus TaxID=36643 RepID=A0A5N6U6G7_ASPAV|nr:hypothetical protein BDV25DRAFT_136168 [Aspergillus avenaceus]